jgi:sugar lactone lactonase YvrE
MKEASIIGVDLSKRSFQAHGVLVPEKVANVCFDGPTRDRLYICGHTSISAGIRRSTQFT